MRTTRDIAHWSAVIVAGMIRFYTVLLGRPTHCADPLRRSIRSPSRRPVGTPTVIL